MSYSNINKSTDFFNTKLWTGNDTDNTSITGITFQPDLVWVKSRTSTNSHALFDAVRGATKYIESDTSDAEATGATFLKSFDSDGFTLGSGGRVNADSQNYCGWNWKAGNSDTNVSASGSGNNCYNACTHRANTTSGFSIVKYTGRNSEISDGQHTRVTHGLGVKPDYLIIKGTDNREWIVFQGNDNDANLHLNKNHATSGSEFIGNQGLNTSTYFNVGNDSHVNENGVEYIAYLFSNKTGFCKSSTYVGNGNTDGTFVYTGFRPSFILIKNTTASQEWEMFDDKRDGYNDANRRIHPNQNVAEQSASDRVRFLSNGFKLVTSGGTHVNGNGNTHKYLAFGQSLVGSNNVPCTAR